MDRSINSLEWITKLFNTIKAGVMIIDPRTKKVIDINDQALILIGKSRYDVIGHCCKDFFCNGCEDKCKLLEENGGAVVEDFESHLEREDGSKLVILKTLNILLCGDRRYLIESFIDITEIREVEMKAQTYLNLAPALFVALDVNGNIKMLNEFGMNLMECDNSIIGSNWFDTFVSPVDKSYIIELFNDFIAGRKIFDTRESEVYTLKGNKRILEWSGAVLKDIKGDVESVLLAGADITERRIVENELEKKWASEEERLTYTLQNLSILGYHQ